MHLNITNNISFETESPADWFTITAIFFFPRWVLPCIPGVPLTHWGRDKMAAVSQTTLSNLLNENVIISTKISLKFVPKGPINKNPALVQIMAWRRSGDKPLSEPMLVSLPMNICVTRPQWVKYCSISQQASAAIPYGKFCIKRLWDRASYHIELYIIWSRITRRLQ